MKWNNLKNGKCPKCSSILGEEMITRMITCSSMASGCDFKISEKRLKEILENKSRNFIPKDNFAELNNLGHEKVAEDFSDSPFLNY